MYPPGVRTALYFPYGILGAEKRQRIGCTDILNRTISAIQRSYISLQNLIFSPNRALQRLTLAALLIAGAAAIALMIGIVGPLIALALAVALVGGALILADNYMVFVALTGVAFVLPFASLPVNIGFKPTLLDVALGA